MGDMDLTLTIEGDSSGAQAAVQQVASGLDELQGAMGGAASAGSEAASGLDEVGAAGGSAASGVEEAGSAAGTAEGDFAGLASGAGEAGGSLEQTVPAANAATNALNGLLGPVTELAGAAGLGALAASTGSWATNMMRLEDMLGASATETETWSNALSDAGVSGEALLRGSTMLQRQIDNYNNSVQQGHPLTNTFTETMTRLGVAMNDGSGHARSLIDVFNDLMHALAAETNSAQQSADIAAVFSRMLGAQLLPVVKDLSGYLGTATGQVTDFGLAEVDAKAQADAWNKSQTDMKDALISLGTDVLPPVSGAFSWLAKGIEGVKEETQPLIDILHGNLSQALQDEGKYLQTDSNDMADLTQATGDACGMNEDFVNSLTAGTSAAAQYESALQKATEAAVGYSLAGATITAVPGGVTYSFAEGGTVPGPYGAPRLVIAHGGEEFKGMGGQYPSEKGAGGMTNYGTIQQVFPNVRDPAGVLAEQNKLFRGV